MSITIGITINSVSYTPEAYAYHSYLTGLGYHVQLDIESKLSPHNDLNIYFMGTRPFWKKKGSAVEIHEYQSLSTPRFASNKDFIKKAINRKPDGRIFLNDVVKEHLNFKDSIPHINRDMGVDDALFQKPSENPVYDIVYCGSINGRVGLVEEIIRLASIGFKILVIGYVSDDVKNAFSSNKNKIECIGRVERKDLPDLYRECKAGLNYTPDIYPFNIQTSTKTLEYLASGLALISNKYQWIESFSASNGISPVWVEEIDSKMNFINSGYFLPKELFSWECVLVNSNFSDFLVERWKEKHFAIE